jgi:7-keto-8-aminopelargonate synthetase-like enzyme
MFCMDGDLAPFPEFVKVCRKMGFYLVIDDVSILSLK